MSAGPPKFFSAILIVLGATTLVFFVFFMRFSALPNTNNNVTEKITSETFAPILQPTITVADPIQGPPTAKITIVEFADYRCSHCNITNLELKKITQTFPTQVRLVWKDFPFLPPLDLTWQAHEAARCAENQGKFWEFHDALFANQEKFSQNLFSNIARSLSLDAKKFQTCLDNNQTKAVVNHAFEEGKKLGVDGTPYFFVNGKKWTDDLTLEKITELLKTIK